MKTKIKKDQYESEPKLKPKHWHRALSSMVFCEKMREINNLGENKYNREIDINKIVSESTLTKKDKLILLYMLNIHIPNVKRKVKFIINN